MSWGSLEAAESFQQELPYLPGDASEEQIEAATKYASWLDVFCRQSNQIRDWMWDYIARRKDHVREKKKAETPAVRPSVCQLLTPPPPSGGGGVSLSLIHI